MIRKEIELLAPAKNKEFGMAALTHGADAVYIGSPKFGARSSAGNSLTDIEELTRYAHLYKAKVFVTLNTLLFDSEIEEARSLAWQLFNIGVDALIIQDMGLLETDLPPIPLHASTQTHNYTPEKVRFLEKAGFQRVILARELSLEKIKAIREITSIELESFVHGALCVCYSGQCYFSHSLNQRSGNRGNCSQPCRSTYRLINESGDMLVDQAHILSLKDFNASASLEKILQAGISSLKIEGRLKDLTYLKNITAFYRKHLDIIIDGNTYHKASSGKTTFFFEPDPERTFNRGFTEYFLQGRKEKTGSWDTQKSLGKAIGSALKTGEDFIQIDLKEKITNGDGLCYFSSQNRLVGFLVNKVEDGRIFPNKKIHIEKGTVIYRNNDHAFEKLLQGQSALRKIVLQGTLHLTEAGIAFDLVDEDGIRISEPLTTDLILAQNPEKSKEMIFRQLSKSGDSPFFIEKIHINLPVLYFFQVSFLNELRRRAIESLIAKRIQSYLPQISNFKPNTFPYPKKEIDYRENVINQKAKEFYQRHGVEKIEWGVEYQENSMGKTLMVCKHCIKYQLEQCPVYYKQSNLFAQSLYIENNNRRFKLHFNCKACEMSIEDI